MIQYALIKRSPQILRWYRTRITLDWDRLSGYLPTQGRLLDVGCGVGSLDYEIARCHPMLNVLGIDVDATSIALAQTYHALPNVEFACQELQSVEGQFDCVLFVDVVHHVPLQEHGNLLQSCTKLLAPGGYVLIKDVERRWGQINWCMDRYISGCAQIYMRDCDEMADTVSQFLRVLRSEVHFRAIFPHYYYIIKAGHLSG